MALEAIEHSTNLDIDVLTAGELASQFVADGGFITIPPDTFHIDFITYLHVGVVERVSRQVVGRQWRLSGVSSRQVVPVSVIDCPILGQQLRSSITSVMWVGETEVDQKGIVIFFRFALVQVVEHLLGVPCAAGLGGAATLGRIANDGELFDWRRRSCSLVCRSAWCHSRQH